MNIIVLHFIFIRYYLIETYSGQSFVNISSGNESGLFELVQQTQFAMFKLLDEKKATKEMYEVEFEASDGQRSERKSRKTLKVFL